MGGKAVDRRGFLAGMAGFSLLAVSPALADTGRRMAFICAMKDREGYGVAALSASGEILRREPLPDRAHGAAISPDGETAVILARRPGRYLGVMDLTGRMPFKIRPPRPDRLFYGHGFFSADGKLFYATENDFKNEAGVLGVYDTADGFNRVGELSSGGVGPHEAILMRDGNTAVVANGGIITHPDYPREELNLPTMDSTLAYIDLASQKVTAVQRLPKELYQMSFRHLAEDAHGTVWIGGQYHGSPADVVPMVFVSRFATGVRALSAPDAVFRNMRHYVGSVAVDAGHGRVATTCPRGGVWQVWDSANQNLIAERRVIDICGVAAGREGFVAVDGLGNFREGETVLSAHRSVAWDNHLLSLNNI
ncbi:DUF1513 domain-containing protein [Hwanghaeella grinnelliae]|uniref:DUF1513 domain-containing protein n=1 Tax=Hwanghaeella grinnelliae TaxID=2500179 RepID=A0A3S2VM44_9PROT|nr:DUF1513 domain-containing protein [Hwanghaeella grinnelliae]RVU33655.1 DUF1513 domain-containing protein [Hwanghaeella grinnelliae]